MKDYRQTWDALQHVIHYCAVAVALPARIAAWRPLLQEDLCNNPVYAPLAHYLLDFAFEADEQGNLILSVDGKEVIEEALFLAASDTARGPPGFSGAVS